MYGAHELVCSAAPAHALRDGQPLKRLLDAGPDECLCVRARYHSPVYQPLPLVRAQGLEFTDFNPTGTREASGGRGGLPAVIIGRCNCRPAPLTALISAFLGDLAHAHSQSSRAGETCCCWVLHKTGCGQGISQTRCKGLAESLQRRRGQLFRAEFDEEVRPAL